MSCRLSLRNFFRSAEREARWCRSSEPLLAQLNDVVQSIEIGTLQRTSDLKGRCQRDISKITRLGDRFEAIWCNELVRQRKPPEPPHGLAQIEIREFRTMLPEVHIVALFGLMRSIVLAELAATRAHAAKVRQRKIDRNLA